MEICVRVQQSKLPDHAPLSSNHVVQGVAVILLHPIEQAEGKPAVGESVQEQCED